MGRVKTLVKIHVQHDIIFLRCLYHPLTLFDVRGQRFLGKNMNLPFSRLQNHLLMKIIRSDHCHCIQSLFVKHFPIVRIPFDSILFIHRFERIRVDIRNCRKFNFPSPVRTIVCVNKDPAIGSGSNNANFCFHFFSLHNNYSLLKCMLYYT